MAFGGIVQNFLALTLLDIKQTNICKRISFLISTKFYFRR